MSQQINSRVNIKSKHTIPVLAIFAFIGVVLLVRSFAANGSIYFESENGNKSGDVRTVTDDTTASGGGYTTLQPSDSAPTPTPTPPNYTFNTNCPNELGYSLIANKSIVFGAAMHDAGLSDSRYTNIATCHFKGIVAENEMKWDETENPVGTFHFTKADKMVNFAIENNLYIRGHALVWHSQSNSINPLSCNRELLLSTMKNHIDTVMGRYKGKVYQWDVVNEAIADTGGEVFPLRSSKWRDCIGEDFIEQAFRFARAADPEAKLYYNDYNIDWTNGKSTKALQLLADLKAKGIIDGVGLQGHWMQEFYNEADNLKMINAYAALGLEIAITEIDVRMPNNSPNLAIQSEIFQGNLRNCIAVSACKTYYVWGISDEYSWIPTFFPGYDNALLFDRNFSPKPVYEALKTLAR